MKLGPLHVVTRDTMQTMQGLMHALAQGLSDANNDRLRLQAELGELGTERDQLREQLADPATASSRLMHSPAFARVAPCWILDPDDADRRSIEAAQRVVDAYHCCQREQSAPAPGMWDSIARRHRDFLTALEGGEVCEVRASLARLFQSDLIWGLGRFHEDMAPQIRANPNRNRIQIQFSDLLVSFAEAVGAASVTCVEQDPKRHARPLDIDLDTLFAEIESRTGLRLDFPPVGGAYGCMLGERRLAADSLVHGYSLWKILGHGGGDIAEIGGGYGGLAALAALNLPTGQYSIFDLPWVNAIQGYFLIMALPPGRVRLFGESLGSIEVLPFWRFFQLPDRSVDLVVNTDSLPEIGRATAEAYVATISRVARTGFFSINQEAQASGAGFESQVRVGELIERHGGMIRRDRARSWLRSGYVEEFFAPRSRHASNQTLDPLADLGGG